MKKHLKIVTSLVLTGILSTTVLPVTSSKVFAAEVPTTSTVANVSNNKPLPETKAEYYNNGFPDRIYVGDEKVVNPESVVIDIVLDETVYIKDGRIEYTKSGGGWSPDFGQIGFIASNGMVSSSFSEMPDRTVAPGEVAFSVILKPDSPIINGTKVKNKHYWKKILSSNLGPTSNTTFVETERYGVTNTEALSLAKSSGTSISLGTDLSTGPITSKFGYQTSDSLTRTFGRTITVEESTEVQIRHQFSNSDRERRVALYQYCEEFEPILNVDSYWVNMLKDHYSARIVAPRSSELKTNSFAGLEAYKPEN